MGSKFDKVFNTAEFGLGAIWNLIVAGVCGFVGVLMVSSGSAWTVLLGVGLIGYALYGCYVLMGNFATAASRR